MQLLSRHIIITLAGFAAISALYYLSLVAGLPLFIFIPIALAAIGGLVIWERRTFRKLPAGAPPSFFMSLLLLSALVLILREGWQASRTYGEWDAMAMWNYHARFLADPVYWRRLYLTQTLDHTDYPLCLPASIAIPWRMLGHATPLVPAGISFWVLLLVPALIFSEICGSSKMWAFGTLLLFTGNHYFTGHAVSQYADTLTGMYFLCAIICMQHFDETKSGAYMLLCGACLGSAMWTKNEGMMLALVFVLFRWKAIIRGGKPGWFVAGAGPVLLALAVHKLFYAPVNDMIGGQGKASLKLLFSGDRALLILRSFRDFLYGENRLLTWFLVLYLAGMVLLRRTAKIPANLPMIGICMLGFMLALIVTPNDLEWQLGTSMNRLIHQLVPATIYVLVFREKGRNPAFPVQEAEVYSSGAYPGVFEIGKKGK